MAGNVIEYTAPARLNFFDNTTGSAIGFECIGPEYMVMASGWSGAAFTANLAIYVPLIATERILISQFFWNNAGTVNGNTDVGIYSFDGTIKLGSTGSTANSGTNAQQVVNVTDFFICPNQRFWMAISSDSATQQYSRNSIAVYALDLLGVKQQASAWSSGLPASATFATPSVAYLPLFGYKGTLP
jgi:hypothetical protein